MNHIKRILYFFCTPCRPKNSFTVRYAFPLVFTFATILGAAAAIQSDSRSYIHIEVSQTSVRAGERFSIDVFVNAHVAVNAVDIKLDLPEAQLKVLGINTGESVITLWTQDPYVKSNTVYLQGGTFRKGFKGNHLIATINVQAVETGMAQVSVGDVLLLAGDGSGSKVSVTKNKDNEKTLFISNGEGTLTESGDPVNVQGTVSIVIVTDIDGDGQVTLADISRFMAAWTSKGTVFDFNGDGRMTFRDFGIILADSFLR